MSDNNRLGFAGTVLLSIVLGIIALLIAIPTFKAMDSVESGRAIGKEIEETYHFIPEIVVNNTVVMQQQRAESTLGTSIRRFNHHLTWTNPSLGATKTISIYGTYEAKIGFDLNKKYEISITGSRAVVVLPQPELLSIEAQDDIVFESEKGIWTWEYEDDRLNAIKAFQEDARKYVDNSTYQEVKNKTEEALTKILEAHGKTADFRYREKPKNAAQTEAAL